VEYKIKIQLRRSWENEHYPIIDVNFSRILYNNTNIFHLRKTLFLHYIHVNLADKGILMTRISRTNINLLEC
jgi:hypothetical protein